MAGNDARSARDLTRSTYWKTQVTKSQTTWLAIEKRKLVAAVRKPVR